MNVHQYEHINTSSKFFLDTLNQSDWNFMQMVIFIYQFLVRKRDQSSIFQIKLF